MLDILTEEIFFAHPINQPPMELGRFIVRWDRNESRFQLDLDGFDEQLELLFDIDVMEFDKCYKRFSTRTLTFESLFLETMIALLRHQAANGPMSDTECHRWSFEMLVSIIQSMPSIILSAANMQLLNVDRDNLSVAFG
jgi:hypothetical protein